MFNFNNVLKLTGFSLSNRKKIILIWGGIVFAIMFMYMIFFPYMKELVQVKLDVMPPEMANLFGLDQLKYMGEFKNYYAMVYEVMVVAIVIYGIVLGGGLIYREESRKSIEFLYSLPVSRIEIYLSKFIATIVGLTIVIVAGGIGTVLCGFFVGGSTFHLDQVLKTMWIMSFPAYFFLSLTFLIGGMTGRVNTGAIGSGVFVITYLVGYLSTLIGNKLDFLGYVSPMKLFGIKAAEGGDWKIHLMVLLPASVVMLVVGVFLYKKRDFRI